VPTNKFHRAKVPSAQSSRFCFIAGHCPQVLLLARNNGLECWRQALRSQVIVLVTTQVA
jgi:hypothetical protein